MKPFIDYRLAAHHVTLETAQPTALPHRTRAPIHAQLVHGEHGHGHHLFAAGAVSGAHRWPACPGLWPVHRRCRHFRALYRSFRSALAIFHAGRDAATAPSRAVDVFGRHPHGAHPAGQRPGAVSSGATRRRRVGHPPVVDRCRPVATHRLAGALVSVHRAGSQPGAHDGRVAAAGRARRSGGVECGLSGAASARRAGAGADRLGLCLVGHVGSDCAGHSHRAVSAAGAAQTAAQRTRRLDLAESGADRHGRFRAAHPWRRSAAGFRRHGDGARGRAGRAAGRDRRADSVGPGSVVAGDGHCAHGHSGPARFALQPGLVGVHLPRGRLYRRQPDSGTAHRHGLLHRICRHADRRAGGGLGRGGGAQRPRSVARPPGAGALPELQAGAARKNSVKPAQSSRSNAICSTWRNSRVKPATAR